jgi:hypothetical protein
MSTPLDTPAVVKAILICFALGMSNYLYAVNFNVWEMFSYLGSSRWEVPWARGQLGGWDSFLDQAQYFGYLLPSLAIIIVARIGLWRPPSLLAIAAAVVQLAFLSQGGGRRIVGVALGAAVIVWVLAKPQLKFKQALGAFAGAAAILWIMQFMLEVRTRGYDYFAAEGRGYDYLHVDDNFLRLAQIIDIVPAEHPYVYLRQPVFVAVRPVPRVFWPGKPVDPGFDLPSVLGKTGVSLSSSIIGEWYISFGWAAVVFGGWLHGRLAAAVNRLRQRPGLSAPNPIAFALAVMVLVSGLRSMQDLVLMSYAILAWYGVMRLLLRSRKRLNQAIPIEVGGAA